MSSTGVLIQGNLIGTDAKGTFAVSNQSDGIDITNSLNTVGGTASGKCNIISGNGQIGVEIGGGGNTGNLVQGNSIGTNSAGTAQLGNSASGVAIDRTASNATIGGEAASAGNIIAWNGTASDAGPGVVIVNGTGDAVLSNSIFSNAGLGIDLGGNGVTLNTPGGPHSGTNNLQNFPVLTAVTTTPTGTFVAGTLDSSPYSTFTIQLFVNDAADPSGFAQGKTFLGEVTGLITNAGGIATFSATFANSLSVAQFVTATATDPVGNTSNSLRTFRSSSTTHASSPTPTTVAQAPRAAITYANANPGTGAATITFAIQGTGVQTISPVSPLPAITVPLIIDGYPGFLAHPACAASASLMLGGNGHREHLDLRGRAQGSSRRLLHA